MSTEAQKCVTEEEKAPDNVDTTAAVVASLAEEFANGLLLDHVKDNDGSPPSGRRSIRNRVNEFANQVLLHTDKKAESNKIIIPSIRNRKILLDANKEKDNDTPQQQVFPPPIIIRNQQDLDQFLPTICMSIFKCLTSKELEGTYQNCLMIELEDAGVTVESEVSINVIYKNRIVGSRRADLVLQTAGDHKKYVIELKALQRLQPNHLKQLEYYMHHLDIDTGYLINFPHDAGFPDLPPSDSNNCVFRQTVLLSGKNNNGTLNDMSRRGRNHENVHIIKVERVVYDPVAAANAAAALLHVCSSHHHHDDDDADDDNVSDRPGQQVAEERKKEVRR